MVVDLGVDVFGVDQKAVNVENAGAHWKEFAERHGCNFYRSALQ